MIYAGELRIGNLFHPISRNSEVHLPATGVIFKVAEILTTGVSAYLVGTKVYQTEYTTFRYADLSPIILTLEILEKAGFEYKLKDALSNWDLYSRNGVFIWNDENNFHFEHSKAMTIGISFFHQLQNIYFTLTGEELPINLAEVQPA